MEDESAYGAQNEDTREFGRWDDESFHEIVSFSEFTFGGSPLP
jgi:hypothetical protein